MYWNGIEGEYNVMIMELLGENLESIFTSANKKAPAKSVALLATQGVY